MEITQLLQNGEMERVCVALKKVLSRQKLVPGQTFKKITFRETRWLF